MFLTWCSFFCLFSEILKEKSISILIIIIIKKHQNGENIKVNYQFKNYEYIIFSKTDTYKRDNAKNKK